MGARIFRKPKQRFTEKQVEAAWNKPGARQAAAFEGMHTWLLEVSNVQCMFEDQKNFNGLKKGKLSAIVQDKEQPTGVMKNYKYIVYYCSL